MENTKRILFLRSPRVWLPVGIILGGILWLFSLLPFLFSSEKGMASQPVQMESIPLDTLFNSNSLADKAYFFQRERKLIQLRQIIPWKVELIRENQIKIGYEDYFYEPASDNSAFFRVIEASSAQFEEMVTENFDHIIYDGQKKFSEKETGDNFIGVGDKENKINSILNQLGLKGHKELLSLISTQPQPTYVEVILNCLIFSAKANGNKTYFIEGEIIPAKAEFALAENDALLLSSSSLLVQKPVRVPREDPPAQEMSLSALLSLIFLPFMMFFMGRVYFQKTEKEEETTNVLPNAAHFVPGSGQVLALSIENGNGAVLAQGASGDSSAERVHIQTKQGIKDLESIKTKEHLLAELVEGLYTEEGEKETSNRLLEQKIYELFGDDMLARRMSSIGDSISWQLKGVYELALENRKSLQESLEGQHEQLSESLENLTGIQAQILKSGPPLQVVQEDLKKELTALNQDLIGREKEQQIAFENYIQQILDRKVDELELEVVKTLHKAAENQNEELKERLKQEAACIKKLEATLLARDHAMQDLLYILAAKDVTTIFPSLTALMGKKKFQSEIQHHLESLGETSLSKVLDRIQKNIKLLEQPHFKTNRTLPFEGDLVAFLASYIEYLKAYRKIDLDKEWTSLKNKIVLSGRLKDILSEEDVEKGLDQLVLAHQKINHPRTREEGLEELLSTLLLEKSTKASLSHWLSDKRTLTRYWEEIMAETHSLREPQKSREEIRIDFILLVDRVLSMVEELSMYGESGLKELNFRSQVMNPLVQNLIFIGIREALANKSGEGSRELDDIISQMIPIRINGNPKLSSYRITAKEREKFGEMIDKCKEGIRISGEDENDNRYIRNLYHRHGKLFKKLNVLEPNQLSEDSISAFFEELLSLGIHTVDYLKYRSLPSVELYEERINMHLVREELEVYELDRKSFKPFSQSPTIPVIAKSIRSLAKSVGVKKLDSVLVEGVYIAPSDLVKD
ncbi:MAG: hypothetical protein AAGA10_10385 [Bacteroidota bacterium]